MSSRVHFEKREGKVLQQSRELLAEQFAKLPDGHYTNDIHPGRVGYNPSRYKFYHDVVMWAILTQAGKHYLITNPSTGEQRPPVSTDEMHLIMKCLYNPVTLQIGRATMTIPGSTTELSDSEFANKFMEQIMADHMGAPYLVDFVDYEIWKGLHKAKEWKQFKKDFKPHDTL